MNLPDLLLRVECYVGLRRAIGYTVRYEEKLLKDFVQFLASRGLSSPIRAQTAIDWACAPAPRRGPAGRVSRLKVVQRLPFTLARSASRHRGARARSIGTNPAPLTVSLFADRD